MPPVHVIPHIIHAGGIPAGIGLLLAGILAWPQSEVAVTNSVVVTSYHNSLGGAGMTLEGATGVLIGALICGALAGLAVGYLLIAAGLFKREDLGIDE